MKITGINHITFSTRDLTQSIKFYCEILHAELIGTWDTGAYLLLGDVWLCLSYDEHTKKSPHDEYTHIALNINDSDFDELEKIIVTHNIILWKINKSEGKSLYILDPDFNKLEIHASSLKDRIEHMIKNPYPGMHLNKEAIKKLIFDKELDCDHT